jgi:Uma2 family endonuclease
MLEAPESLLAERRRLGHDLFDEMWEGELHMVPRPSEEHQRIGTKLVALLDHVAEEAGLLLRYETSVFDPSVEDYSSYRTPDLVVFSADYRSARGVEGAGALAIEIRSPGDETFDKIPFYDRVGVGEVLVIDRDSKEVRYWDRNAGQLAERAPEGGWIGLQCLPVRFHGVDGVLSVETPSGVTRI